MAITIRGTAAGGSNNFTSTNPSLTLPAGIEDGDRGFILLALDTNRTVTPPSGWTQIGSTTAGATYTYSSLWTKVLSATDSSTTAQFALNLSAKSSLSAIVLDAVEAVNVSTSLGIAYNTTLTIPAVTPTVADHMSVAFIGVGYANPSADITLADWTQRVHSKQGPQGAAIYTRQYTGGANTTTGTSTGSVSAQSSKAVFRIALEPSLVNPNALVDVDTPTATYRSNEATQESVFIPTGFDSVAKAVTADYMWDTSTGAFNTTNQSTTVMQTGGSGGQSLSVHRISPLTKANAEGIGFKFSHDSNTNITVRLILSDNNATLGEAKTIPAGNYVGTTVNFTMPTSQTVYGFRIESGGTSTHYFVENSNTALRPSAIAYVTPVPVSINVDVPTVSVSALANEPTLEVQSNIDITLDTSALTFSPNDDYVVEVSVSDSVDVDSAIVSYDSYELTSVDVTTSPNIDIENVTPVVSFAAPEAEFVYNNAEDTVSAVVDLSTEDVTIDTVFGAIFDVDSPRMTTKAVWLTDVNGEAVLPSEIEDPYFESTWDTLLYPGELAVNPVVSGGMVGGNTSSPAAPESAAWYRFNERSGTAASDRAFVYRNYGGEMVSGPEQGGTISGKSEDLSLNGVVVGLNDGPEGRHHFGFTGTSWIRGLPGGPSTGQTNLEFTFRTSKANQFIMGGGSTSTGLSDSPNLPWELWMVDGVLEVRQSKFGADPRLTGLPEIQTRQHIVTRLRQNVADGEWHHVVIQRAPGGEGIHSTGGAVFQFEAYIDGRLDVRRRVGTPPPTFPQYIGGRPDQWYRSGQWNVEGPILAPDQWFEGDMSELIFRAGNLLTENEVTRQRDNVMSILTYRASAARATFMANDNFLAKGNKLRALVLDFGSFNYDPLYPMAGAESRNTTVAIDNAAYNSLANKMQHGPAPIDYAGYTTADFPGYGEPHVPWYGSEIGGLVQAFRYDVQYKMDAFGRTTNEPYRDEITDNNRLIDLLTDLNMDDYQLISIVGFPRNNIMWGRYESMDTANIDPKIPAKAQIENLFAQIREQVVNHGKSLYITDPFSAINLGIINDVEGVPKFQESYMADQRIGANTGGMDREALITDPFGTAAGGGWATPREFWGFDPRENSATNRNRAAQYEDMHANLKQQVRNVIPGLTTNYGWVKTDDIVWWNVNPMANPPFNRSIKYADKRGPDGLEVGDMFYLSGEHIYDWGFRGIPGVAAQAIERRNGWVATPMSAIKVGKAVTTFAPFLQATTWPTEQNDVQNEFVSEAIGNPYGNHAVSIAVEPGDVWNGERVTGKVYINFTEFNTHNPEHYHSAQIMQLRTRHPNARLDDTLYISKQVNNGYDHGFTITKEMLAYQWSTHYGAWQGSQIPLESGGKRSDWGWSSGGTRESGGFSTYGAGEAMQWGWRSTVPLETIPTPAMFQKGFRWLLQELDTTGTVNAGVASASVNTNANDVTVDTVQNMAVDVSSARVIIESYDDANTFNPNTSVMVSTVEVRVRAVGLLEQIALDTPTVSVDVGALDEGPVEINWDEALVFIRPTQYLTLTMEET